MTRLSLACLIVSTTLFSTGFHCHDRRRAGMVPPNTPQEAASSARSGLEVVNRSREVVTIRVAPLRAGLDVDCEMIRRYRPYIPASAFGKVDTITLEPSGKHELSVDDGGTGCMMLRFEEGKTKGVTIGVAVADQRETLQLHDNGSWRPQNRWTWITLNPSTKPTELPACSEGAEVGWSTPIPVGDKLTVASSSHAQSCDHLQLVGSSGDSFRWRTCAGEPLPLAAGDKLSISIAATKRGTDTTGESVVIERLRASSKTTITLNRGSLLESRQLATVPRTYINGVYSSGLPTCVSQDPCQQSWLPAHLNVQFGSNRLVLGTGDHAKLGDTTTGASFEVRILRARARFISSQGCFPSSAPTSQIDSVSILTLPVVPELERAAP